MRGAARIGGRAFKAPRSIRAGRSRDLSDYPNLGELPVSPSLVPINDEWSTSVGGSPADPRDCARYPASPYCDGDFLDLSPVGYRIDIKSNECETCIYTYPILAFLVLTPVVVCRRNPNCRKKEEPKKPSTRPGKYDENTTSNRWQSPECAERINTIHRRVNATNDYLAREEEAYSYNLEHSDPSNIKDVRDFTSEWYYHDLRAILIEGDNFSASGKIALTYEGVIHREGDNGDGLSVGVPAQFGYSYVSFTPGPCPGKNIPPPPPFGNDDDDLDRKDKNKRGGDKMCCNDCKDSVDLNRKILKILGEGVIKVPKSFDSTLNNTEGKTTDLTQSLEYFGKLIAERLGTGRYPIEVPESLLADRGDKMQQVPSLTDYMWWLTNQADAIIGEFPIEIEVKDIDPLREGDQKKQIKLPNLAESIAEIYGLTIKNSVNQEVELNMLLRLAAEIIATKNGVVVAQDYARANAGFLGYKGNFKARELLYNFDFGSVNLDPKNNQPIILEKLLKTTKGFVQGWELEDKETVVGFLQKLMFSAGIIKAVFFRGKNLTKQLNKEATSMANDEKNSDKDWEGFLQQLNNPNSMFNKDSVEKPEVRESPKDPRKS